MFLIGLMMLALDSATRCCSLFQDVGGKSMFCNVWLAGALSHR